MSESFDTYANGVMSGRDRSFGAHALRAITRVAEPFYAGAMRLRNALYDHGLFKTHHLPRPVISVGNLTTGGTGKTPIVCWLVDKLRDAGHRPAVLMRGYKSSADRPSDEAMLIDEIVNKDPISRWKVPVIANPDRIAGAKAALDRDSRVDVFVLDDAYQHRRVHRDFNLLLIDRTNPDGFGHVLPRGMLREHPRGISRADAVLLTRCPLNPEHWTGLESFLGRYRKGLPIYRSFFDLVNQDRKFAGWKVFGFCGIGNPNVFIAQLSWAGMVAVDHQLFGDHHAYTVDEIESLQRRARLAGADALVTTRKDWVKVKPLGAGGELPIVALDQRLQFHDDHETRLLEQIKAVIDRASPAGSSAPQASDSEAR